MRLARSMVFGVVIVLMVACHDRKRRVDPALPPVETPPVGSITPVSPSGLVLSADRMTVRDLNQGVTWLADANLASDPAVCAAMGVKEIRPNGTMTYEKALEWVHALNNAAYLGHDDWQLPTTPRQDDTCAIGAGPDGNSYGPGCKGSALGRLYSAGFLAAFPEGIVRATNHLVGPFHHLQQAMYWTSGETRNETPRGAESAYTFNFTNHAQGRKTTKGNYFHVLPMVVGAIGPKPVGSGLVPYRTGPAAGLAVYDSQSDVTWPLDGTLALSKRDLVAGTVEVRFPRATFWPARIDVEGKMLFATAHRWLEALNGLRYAGSTDWVLPSSEDLRSLHAHLGGAAPGWTLVENGGLALPFRNLQLFFYWSCPAANGASRALCSDASAGDGPNEDGGTVSMQFAYNLASGFQGTDKGKQEYFVQVYYPHL